MRRASIHHPHGIDFTRTKSRIIAIALLFLATCPSDQAFAQQQGSTSLREQLVGAWTLTELSAVTWDEDDRNPFGSAPTGRMIFDRDGNVTCVIIGAARPRFALGERLSGTAEENRSVVQSTQAFYGTYSVDEDNKTVAFHVERSLFPIGMVRFKCQSLQSTATGWIRAKQGRARVGATRYWQRIVEGRLRPERVSGRRNVR